MSEIATNSRPFDVRESPAIPLIVCTDVCPRARTKKKINNMVRRIGGGGIIV